jgi:hypothetical protein
VPSELDELRRRLDRLEAREACVSAFNEYLHYLDGDFVDFPPGTGKDLHFKGRAAIRPLYADHRAGIGRHHSANVTVNPAPDARSAELSAYFVTSGPFQFGGGIYQIELDAAPERWLFRRMNIVSTWGWRIEADAEPYLAKALGAGAWRSGRPVRYRP